MKSEVQYCSAFHACVSFVSNDIANLYEKFIYQNSGIYEIINKVNGHKYIGQSRNIYQRINEHKSLLKNQKHLYKNGEPTLLQRAWNKYGEENFEFKILQLCHSNKLNEREKYWINYYNTNRADGGDGYNLNNGGGGQKHNYSTVGGKIIVNNGIVQKFIYPNELSKYEKDGYKRGLLEENRKKFLNNKKILSGKEHPAWGKPWTKEHRENAMIGIQKAQKEGKYNWKRGKRSEETTQKIINALKGKPINENSRKALAENAKNKRKAVVQLDMNCNYIATYSGINKAAEEVGIAASGICKCCKGEKESVKGFKWMYENEYKML